MRSRKLLCHVVALFAVSLMASGCGDVHPREGRLEAHMRDPKIIQSLPAGKYTLEGSWVLVREKILEGYVSIIGKRYRSGREVYSMLAGRVEQSSKKMTSIRGFPLVSDSSSALQMTVYRGCTGLRPYALAFGLLRRPKDEVTAENNGRAVVMKKVEIPVSFYRGSVLVYALLGTGTTNILTRASDARVVSVVTYIGQEAKTVVCHNR